MQLIVLIVGAILVVSAIRDSQGQLFAALQQDVPGYFVWAGAIFVLGAIGWIPGLKPVSRGLLALVLIVIVLRNYQAALVGFNISGKPATGGVSVSQNGSGSQVASAATGAANNLQMNGYTSIENGSAFSTAFGVV